MIKKHLKTMIVITVINLLPILAGLILWNHLPDQLPTHWNAAGDVDGWASKPCAVFFFPVLMAAIEWVCLLGTLSDPKKANHSEKVLQLVLWIIPMLNIVMHAVIYMTALGKEIRMEMIMPVLIGLILAIVGNYLPKCKQNYTIGIKIPWTLSSEENWNKTHRFAGILWVVCGFMIMLTGFFGGIWLFLPVVLLMVLVPFAYSYRLHRKGI